MGSTIPRQVVLGCIRKHEPQSEPARSLHGLYLGSVLTGCELQYEPNTPDPLSKLLGQNDLQQHRMQTATLALG